MKFMPRMGIIALSFRGHNRKRARERYPCSVSRALSLSVVERCFPEQSYPLLSLLFCLEAV